MDNKKFAGMRIGEPIIGHVVNCSKLTVRSESTDDFYNICAASGFEGFCMKQFIEVEE